MTYRQLLAALEQAQEWEEAKTKLCASFPAIGTAEARDAHQAVCCSQTSLVYRAAIYQI